MGAVGNAGRAAIWREQRLAPAQVPRAGRPEGCKALHSHGYTGFSGWNYGKASKGAQAPQPYTRAGVTWELKCHCMAEYYSQSQRKSRREREPGREGAKCDSNRWARTTSNKDNDEDNSERPAPPRGTTCGASAAARHKCRCQRPPHSTMCCWGTGPGKHRARRFPDAGLVGWHPCLWASPELGCWWACTSYMGLAYGVWPKVADRDGGEGEKGKSR